MRHPGLVCDGHSTDRHFQSPDQHQLNPRYSRENAHFSPIQITGSNLMSSPGMKATHTAEPGCHFLDYPGGGEMILETYRGRWREKGFAAYVHSSALVRS